MTDAVLLPQRSATFLYRCGCLIFASLFGMTLRSRLAESAMAIESPHWPHHSRYNRQLSILTYHQS